jgi:hypothetical protein
MTGTFEGVGTLQFTPDNKMAYAVSGIINVNNLETTALEFTTNSEYLISKLQVLNGTDSNEDFLYRVFFNNIIIAQWRCLQLTTIDINMPNYYNLIIPPFTTVKVTGQNNTSSTIRVHSATLVAKVGGAIEQQNLEAITDNSNWASK